MWTGRPCRQLVHATCMRNRSGFTIPEGDKLKHKIHLQYQATNNEVEYEALLKGLDLAKSVEAKSILVLGDSQLVMGQINRTCEAKEKRMRRYLERVL